MSRTDREERAKGQQIQRLMKVKGCPLREGQCVWVQGMLEWGGRLRDAAESSGGRENKSLCVSVCA